MTVHSLLVRYKGGYFVKEATGGTGPGGRGYLELGQVEDRDEAEDIAYWELERLKHPLSRITADADPRATAVTDRVYLGWNVGDYVNTIDETGAPTTVRVRQIDVTQDDESGEITVLPRLASRLEEYDARLARIIRRRLNGTLDGRSASTAAASPADSVRVRPLQKAKETFNWSGQVSDPDLLGEINGPKQWDLDGRLATIKFTWRTWPASDATVRLYRDGSALTDYTLPANERTHWEFPNLVISRTNWFDMAVLAVDEQAQGLTAEATVVYFE